MWTMWQKPLNFFLSPTSSHTIFDMHCSNNLHLCDQAIPPNIPLLHCSNPQCTHLFITATSLALHVHWGIHSIDDTVKDNPLLSPKTVNLWAELQASSSPPPIQPFNPLFPELEEDNLVLPPPQDTSPSSPTSLSSSPPLNKCPPFSPTNIDTNSSSYSSTKSATSSQSHIQVDGFEAHLGSLIGSILDECVALSDEEFSSNGGKSNANDEDWDDAGIPVKQNYHPHLNGMSSIIMVLLKWNHVRGILINNQKFHIGIVSDYCAVHTCANDIMLPDRLVICSSIHLLMAD